ncbi:MAG: hypothetical protein U0930_14880 [Pirellulales bacterium]
MSRFIRTSFSMATIGLASFQAARADDSFIVQPKLQQAIATKSTNNVPNIGIANPHPALVVQPSKTSQSTRTGSSQSGVQSDLANQSKQAHPTSGSDIELQPTPTVEVNRQSDAQFSHNSHFPTPLTNDSWKDPNGLTWIKRGSIEANKAAEATRYKNDTSSSHFVDRSSPVPSMVTTPLASRQPVNGSGNIEQYSNNALQGQATASAFSLAKASSSVAPVWLDANPANSPANNPYSPAVQNAARENQGNDSRAQKLHLASKVSKQILADRTEPTKQLSLNGTSITGPAAVEQQLTALMSRSEQLCRRGMFLSAREESFAAMIQLSRYLDSLSNNLNSEPCLRAARTAMREAEDFSELLPLSSVQELAGSHETPVLKGVDLTRVPPASLAQLYYQHAESKLMEGSQQHPWFSDIFYSVGRTYQAEADSQAELGATHLRLQAVVFYRAATTIRPKNSLAANQLGFVLLQMDRPREAQLALVASVDTKLDLPALQNLAEASRRLGDQRMHQWAVNMIASLQRQSPSPNQPQAPQVLEVDNRTFGQTTPIVPTRSNSTPAQTANTAGAALR